MKIVPARIEEQINRVDRQRSLYVGLSAGAVAVWSAFRLSLCIGMTFGWLLGAMVLLALWDVIGAVAGVAAVGFLTRYAEGS